jgi:hypothetical protein
MNLSDKISALKELIKRVGQLWPAPSTKLAGYAESGPYHCKDCIFLRGYKEGNIYRDENGKGRCGNEFMMADPETKKDKDGYAIVNIEKGCCEFVDPGKKDMEDKRSHKFTHTHIDLHDDGSATVHHVHEDGPDHDIKHAAGDLDEIHDSLQKHLNHEQEEELEEKVRPGIHEEIKKLAEKKEE